MRRSASLLMASTLLFAACSGGGDTPADEAPQSMELAAEPQGCGYPADAAERPSPPDSVEIPLGDATAKLCYGRPSVKGRVMVGGQDPFGRPWRMGANEPTTLHLPVGASIGGVEVESGSYVLYAIPTEGEWTIAVNGAIERWGIPINAEVRAADVGEFTVTPEALDEPVETLTFTWEDGALVYAWEERTFRIPVEAM